MFDDDDVVGIVAQALETSGLDPARLELEITEGLLLKDTCNVIDALDELRRIGVTIAMDDFGTGYSSLSYLTRVPISKIKIDKSFIHQLGDEETVDSVVQAVVGLGRSLGVTVCAEGVETVEQLTRLQAMGCTSVQGFLYGRADAGPVCSAAPGHRNSTGTRKTTRRVGAPGRSSSYLTTVHWTATARRSPLTFGLRSRTLLDCGFRSTGIRKRRGTRVVSTFLKE